MHQDKGITALGTERPKHVLLPKGRVDPVDFMVYQRYEDVTEYHRFTILPYYYTI